MPAKLLTGQIFSDVPQRSTILLSPPNETRLWHPPGCGPLRWSHPNPLNCSVWTIFIIYFHYSYFWIIAALFHVIFLVHYISFHLKKKKKIYSRTSWFVHLHSSHHFLSTWGMVIASEEKRRYSTAVTNQLEIFFFFLFIVTAPQVERKRWLECRW